MIARQWAQRDKVTLRLPPSYMGLMPGVRLELDLTPRAWRVEQCSINGFVTVAELRPVLPIRAAATGDGGRIAAQDDAVAADVSLALFEVPDLFQQDAAEQVIMLAASSASGGWNSRNAEILAGGQSLWVRTARRKSVLGAAATLLEEAVPHLVDGAASLDVVLIDQEQWLTSCDDEALAVGCNLAVLGSEVLQFGDVEPLGPGRFRLTRLRRGCAGTEWAMEGHAVGEPFALIEREALTAVPVPLWMKKTNVIAVVRNPSGTSSVSAPLSIGTRETDQAALPG